jgi:hypothetical protein
VILHRLRHTFSMDLQGRSARFRGCAKRTKRPSAEIVFAVCRRIVDLPRQSIAQVDAEYPSAERSKAETLVLELLLLKKRDG